MDPTRPTPAGYGLTPVDDAGDLIRETVTTITCEPCTDGVHRVCDEDRAREWVAGDWVHGQCSCPCREAD